MTEIKDKELQEFWEWCGFKHEVRVRRNSRWHCWIYPDGKEDMTYPPIDLNNLFKYAVPKLAERGDVCLVGSFECSGYFASCHYCTEHEGEEIRAETPALALYQAIQKARKVSNDRDK